MRSRRKKLLTQKAENKHVAMSLDVNERMGNSLGRRKKLTVSA
jgi:hypothetical protein